MCWKAEYIILILFSTGVDFVAAQKMEAEPEEKKKRNWLLLSLLANLGILFLFKYFNLFNDTAREVFDHFNIFYGIPAFEMLLPVGISFYTFQTLAYTIDVYRGNLKAERKFIDFALYVSFFPQLVAGPIERANRLLPQFKRTYHFEYTRVVGGIQQMIWGFFKKLVIADRIAPMVNTIYNDPTGSSEYSLLIGTYLFAIQIYCDFSGYSDIAIGAARVLGIDLMDNFKVPYLSKSIREFWKRWHISLSTWFRDYLYIPLGGNRVAVPRWYLNLLIVFVVSGLWHGANWTFVVWGALHGSYLVFEILWNKSSIPKLKEGRLKNMLSVFFTFHLVLLAWIFFRANTVNDAFYITQQIISIPLNFSISGFIEGVFSIDAKGVLLINFLLFGIFFLLDPKMDKLIKRIKNNQNLPNGLWVSASLLAAIVLFGHFGEVEFIYFQF